MTSTSTQYTQWEWDDIAKTYRSTAKCHTGNTALYTEPDGGTLFIGGWNNGAIVSPNTHVIDLTGTEHRYYEMPVAFDEESKKFIPFVQQSCAGWLSLPFPDMGVPKTMTTFEQWQGVTSVIRDLLKRGKDVLVACLGGHGRSGMFCAIVGHILGLTTNPEWASPVEHLRKIHCLDTVETSMQEEFVYKILKLNLPISDAYTVYSKGRTCPLCGTVSIYVEDFGMCMGCKTRLAPFAKTVTDLTEDDLNNIAPHNCKNENCLGLWRASGCGHVVHDMLVLDGKCEQCYNKDEKLGYAQKYTGNIAPCAICETDSYYGKLYGVCYDCSESLKQQNNVDYIHNSFTDGYRAVPHHCEGSCYGVVAGDVCGHVVHNKLIEDGICEDCQQFKETQRKIHGGEV